ncbi:SMI1/KNR4 family protein [Kitasatospora sp. NPDC090091]|uniref:SMI1/KNR4 family protein n=1 Tax=Kitasatospora sp. NPDC090091 TaxID=3364081 RepID=UPI00382E85EB
MTALDDFATWEPLLRLLRAAHAERLAAPGGYVAGRIARDGWSLPALQPRRAVPVTGVPVTVVRGELDAVQQVQDALAAAGVDDVAFTAEIPPGGRAVLQLFTPSAAVGRALGNAHPGALLLVEGAVPAPWRRRPEAVPEARPAPSADLALLERTLRERIPDAVGATEEEIAAAEARLGFSLPAEVRVLYRVTRARPADWVDDDEAAERVFDAVGFELTALDCISVADTPDRSFLWELAATEAAVTPPDSATQNLVGSPGWVVIGETGGGDRVAVDLTPGPRGHTGQVIVLDRAYGLGAGLLAESLTDLVQDPERSWCSARSWDRPPYVARIHRPYGQGVEAAAHPGLEVLSLGGTDGEPFSLAAVVGLPRLRTLVACPGTLVDPLEIAGLTGLEFLSLPPEDWRALLDADAVPRSLAAAGIGVYTDRDPRPVMALANELLALRGRPPITETVVEGELGRLP